MHLRRPRSTPCVMPSQTYLITGEGHTFLKVREIRYVYTFQCDRISSTFGVRQNTISVIRITFSISAYPAQYIALPCYLKTPCLTRLSLKGVTVNLNEYFLHRSYRLKSWAFRRGTWSIIVQGINTKCYDVICAIILSYIYHRTSAILWKGF